MAVGKRIRGLPLPGLLGALLACAAGCDSATVLTEAAPASTPWRLVSPRDFPVRLTAVWGEGPDRLLAVGSFGAVLVKEGAAWREAPRPTTGSFYDLHGCDWQHVYGITAEGLLFFDGRCWTRTGPADLGDGARVWCRGPDDVMVVTVRGVSHHFDGAAWTRATVPVDPYWTGPGHWLTGTSDGYLAVGFRGAAYWRGGRWEPVPGATDHLPLLAVCRADSAGSERYLAIDFGGVLELVRGAGWRRHAWLNGSLTDIVSAGGGRALVFDESGPSATIRSDTGDSLAIVTGVRPGRIWAVPSAGADPRPLVVFVGGLGTIAAGRLPGEGLSPGTAGLRVVPSRLVSGPDGGFACAADGRALLRGRAGSLTLDPPAQDYPISALAPAGAGGYLTAYHGGAVVRHRPDGTWQELAPVPFTSPRSLWCAATGEIWVGGPRQLWRGDGTAWEAVPADSLDTVQAILGHGPADVYILESRRILHWDGDSLAVLHEGSWLGAGSAILAADGDGIFCAIEAQQGGGALNPTLRRVRRGGGESVAALPGDAYGLVDLGRGEFLVATWWGLHRRVGGRWVAQPHPAVDEGGRIDRLAGDTVGGVYSLSKLSVIHHLDLGGTGLWR